MSGCRGQQKSALERASRWRDVAESAAAAGFVAPDTDGHQPDLLLLRGSQQFGDSDDRDDKGGDKKDLHVHDSPWLELGPVSD
ncbi:hypothetical protein [Chromobacterium phragmitis]|uniref:hypothetical protein n=2 Tax=Chromobacterium phragmitis TaxID=2202141 RepID=UPI00387820E3